jgi:hypothetical protein
MAATTSAISAPVPSGAWSPLTSGPSSTNAPNRKYTMEISGRVAAVPNHPHASAKLASVTRNDSALKKCRCASACTTTGAVIRRGTAWYSTPLSAPCGSGYSSPPWRSVAL